MVNSVRSQQSTVRSLKKFGLATVFCLLSCVFCLFQNCTPDPPPTLNFKDREIVDSLYALQVDSLKTLYDSLCEMRHDSAVQFKVDSMMEVRQSEIERYLERIRREQELEKNEE